MCGISPMRSYHRRVCADRPVRAATSLIVYLPRPPARRSCCRDPAQLSVLVVSITVMAPTLEPWSALQASHPGRRRRDGRGTEPVGVRATGLVRRCPGPGPDAADVLRPRRVTADAAAR